MVRCVSAFAVELLRHVCREDGLLTEFLEKDAAKPEPEKAPILRDPLALAMLAAWVNAPVDKLPAEMQAHTCEATMTAWKRVGEAALAYFRQQEVANG